MFSDISFWHTTREMASNKKESEEKILKTLETIIRSWSTECYKISRKITRKYLQLNRTSKMEIWELDLR